MKFISGLFILFLSFELYAFENTHFKMVTPYGRVEEPGMFGSDVMFLKKIEKGEGAIFVKYIVNEEPISNTGEFLRGLIRHSKTVKASHISKLQDQDKFQFVTYKDLNTSEEVLSGLFQKDTVSYVFFMLKDSPSKFQQEKEILLKALKSFKLK